MIKILKSLGPGLLFAGAAIGVSHLVQSTRAGADYGFGLVWALVIVNILKYPFFEFGARYASATGNSLIDGYGKLGKWVLGAHYALSYLSIFTIQAAVTIVTAGLAINLFGITNDPVIWSAIILAIALVILIVGKYKLLDNLMKVIIITLTITTIASVCIAIFKTDHTVSFQQIIPSDSVGIAFLIAFLGWMPAPLDVSIWNSIWTVEKKKQDPNIDPKKSLLDFNIGYVGTLILGACFVALGALVMYGTGESLSPKAIVFCNQLIEMYTDNIGSGAYIFIGAAAFTTMFSTTLSAFDASPRMMARSQEILFDKSNAKKYYAIWIGVLFVGTLIILKFFISSMGVMIKIATILSFLTAPFYAIINHILISGKHTPKEYHPSQALKILSIVGIVFLIGFSVWYLMNL